jgi:ferredoxin
MYEIRINKDECIGCGTCVAICPENFELKNGKANAKKKELKEAGCSSEAAESCPVQCIKIIEKK